MSNNVLPILSCERSHVGNITIALWASPDRLILASQFPGLLYKADAFLSSASGWPGWLRRMALKMAMDALCHRGTSCRYCESYTVS